MKKLTTISLIIFAIFTTAILMAGLIFYQNNKNDNPGSNGSALINSSGQLPSQSGTNSLVLNAQEVAKHNLAGDCWMIINNKVYNVTSYLFIHPGGAGSMTPYCGQEATQAFDTKDRNRPHSNYAASLLASYLVGELNQVVTQQQVQQNPQNTNSTAPSSRNRGYNGFDD